MNIRPLISITLLAALAACASPPQASNIDRVVESPAALQATIAEGIPADRQVYPAGNTFRLLAVEELPLVGVTASSSTSGFAPSRAIDGDLSTQWVDGGYRNATSWLAVELAATSTIASIDIKTGPSPAGTSYDVQVSANGTSWTTERTGLTNTTWSPETKTLPAGTTGKFVRVFWKNSTSNPQAHFSIFELNVNGEGGATPSATPTASPTATPTMTPSTTPTAVPATKATPTGAAASSTYSPLVPQRAIDGNLSTQWANGGYREPSAWLRLAYGSGWNFTSVRIKTGALRAGVTYVIETSFDGETWTAASGNQTNSTWNLETKTVSGSGRFLRVRFTNSPSSPVARFAVYEVEAYGEERECTSLSGEGFLGQVQADPYQPEAIITFTNVVESQAGVSGSAHISYTTGSTGQTMTVKSVVWEDDHIVVKGDVVSDSNPSEVVGKGTITLQPQSLAENGDFTAGPVSYVLRNPDTGAVITSLPDTPGPLDPRVTGNVGDCQ